jgi:hypothetical protein
VSKAEREAERAEFVDVVLPVELRRPEDMGVSQAHGRIVKATPTCASVTLEVGVKTPEDKTTETGAFATGFLLADSAVTVIVAASLPEFAITVLSSRNSTLATSGVVPPVPLPGVPGFPPPPPQATSAHDANIVSRIFFINYLPEILINA